MRRLAIFVLLGPPLGLAVALWLMLPLLNLALGEPQWPDGAAPLLLPLAYALGFLPALVAGLFDALLAHNNVRRRPLWCGLFGYVASYLPLLTALADGFMHGPFLLLFGLVGAAPAALCSWLAVRWLRA